MRSLVRLPRSLIAALLALAPSLALAQGAPPTIRIPKGSTGPADSLTVGGTALPSVLGSKAPLASPTFSGTVTAPVFSGDVSATVATPSVTAPAGSVARLVAASAGLGLSTVYMPPPTPTGSDAAKAAADAANFAAAQATGARTIVFQAGTYLMPPTGYPQLQSNQYIQGQGSGLTFLRNTSQGTYSTGLIYAIEKNDAGISGITIDYGGFREPQTRAGVLGLVTVTRFKLEDVNIAGFSRFGLELNGAVELSYVRGKISRAASPLDASGNAIPLGATNRCVQGSQNTRASIRLRFEDVIAIGCGFGIGAEDVDYVRTVVDGFSFGSAYVADQWPNARAHRFVNVKASRGRANPTTGKDDDNTFPACFEVWAKDSVIDSSECSDVGGSGIAIGGQNVRVINNKISKVGMATPSEAIAGQYQDATYNATGSIVSNNIVINSNASGDGSNLTVPYRTQDGSPPVKINITSNNFPNIAYAYKNEGEIWSAPGMFVSGHYNGGTAHTPCSTRGPLGLFFRGAVRARDVIVGVTYVGDDGSALPPTIRAYAEVSSDNNITFYTQDVRSDCSGANVSIPPGTFSARLITIN